MAKQLPLPPHYKPANVGEVRSVPYEKISAAGREWARKHALTPAASDKVRIAVMGIDQQMTFCLPGFELYVGGRSGTGALDDSARFTEFIYRNLGVITQIFLTMDTHTAMQIFHAIYWINENGEHPAPFSVITVNDVKNKKWRVNPAVTPYVMDKPNLAALEAYVLHYVTELAKQGRYALNIWPYHAVLGGIGHAIVPTIEEAAFFHLVARSSQTGPEVKGGNPLTENYSILGPEVKTGTHGEPIGQKNTRFLQKLLTFDRLYIAGQAKSHCYAWTIADLLDEIAARDPSLAKKVYLLDDCSSPVVVPGVVDYTDEAEAAMKRFAAAGMHVVKSTDPIDV